MASRFRIDIAAGDIARKWGLEGDGPTTIKEGPDGLLVRVGGDEWDCVSLNKRDEGRSYDLYVLDDPNIMANPPPPLDGAAVLADGTSYYLSDPTELRAFWRRLGSELEPMELADLLVRFQNGGINQHLITRLSDLARWLDVDAVKQLRGFTLPAIDGQSSLGVAFCSYAISWPQDPTGTIWRWNVRTDASGDLSWKSEIIGSKIHSPFYSPTPDTERDR